MNAAGTWGRAFQAELQSLCNLQGSHPDRTERAAAGGLTGPGADEGSGSGQGSQAGREAAELP